MGKKKQQVEKTKKYVPKLSSHVFKDKEIFKEFVSFIRWGNFTTYVKINFDSIYEYYRFFINEGLKDLYIVKGKHATIMVDEHVKNSFLAIVSKKLKSKSYNTFLLCCFLHFKGAKVGEKRKPTSLMTSEELTDYYKEQQALFAKKIREQDHTDTYVAPFLTPGLHCKSDDSYKTLNFEFPNTIDDVTFRNVVNDDVFINTNNEGVFKNSDNNEESSLENLNDNNLQLNVSKELNLLMFLSDKLDTLNSKVDALEKQNELLNEKLNSFTNRDSFSNELKKTVSEIVSNEVKNVLNGKINGLNDKVIKKVDFLTESVSDLTKKNTKGFKSLDKSLQNITDSTKFVLDKIESIEKFNTDLKERFVKFVKIHKPFSTISYKFLLYFAITFVFIFSLIFVLAK